MFASHLDDSGANVSRFALQHHPHSQQQGIPPPHLQHPRAGVIQHHNPPDTAHQARAPQSSGQGPYASPHSSTPTLPQHQSPYLSNIPGASAQAPQELPYYSAQPSPYSTNSAPSYSSSDTPELMATATMNRPYPPVYTPQSASPASVPSPHDAHGRQIYGHPQSMYYPTYPVSQQSPYGHPGAQQATPLAASFSQAPGQPLPHYTSHPHTPAPNTSPSLKMSQPPLQRPPSGLGPGAGTPTQPPGSAGLHHQGPAGGSAGNPNAAPGPIPATTPLVVRQDQNGVQWIAFEYSRDRVKMEYTIRCDVESIDVNSLPQDFKTENCVYPRACCPKDQYKGNRLHYETECNTVGWALAQLNPCLRGKRGLIQRAVDSWRNSNQDPRLRSRRVRRMAKITNRKHAATHGSHLAGPGGPAAAGVPTAAALGTGPPRQPSMGMGGPTLHHHHHEHPGAPGAGDDVSAGHDYSEGSHTHHHQAPNGHATDVRPTQNFYPAFPTPSNMAGSLGGHEGLDHVNPHGPSHPQAISVSAKDEEDKSAALFGDLPETKRRKFILVDDTQRGTRVRVRVMLDQVKMQEMPDSYRKNNSVYPRSYYAVQMQSPPATPGGSRFPEDEDANDEGSIGRTLVPVPMLDGSEAKIPLPRMNKSRRQKEETLNDLGYRMSWSQSRTFSGRTLFLQRSLDAYRNKMRSTMVSTGQDVATIAPHFETRVGKRKWLERTKKSKTDSSP